MTNPVAVVRDQADGPSEYKVLVFICPGCNGSGVHMLPITGTGDIKGASWEWDGNLEAPTLSPSILTMYTQHGKDGDKPFVCHSFLKAGVFQFLEDCTHELRGKTAPLPPLPDWVL